MGNDFFPAPMVMRKVNVSKVKKFNLKQKSHRNIVIFCCL